MKKILSAIALSLIIGAQSIFAVGINSNVFVAEIGTTGLINSTLYINEIMAANTTTIRDGDVDDPNKGSLGGAYSDWIELYNPGSQTVNLSGYSLSDSSATWTFPSVEIPAKGYLIVWASDKDKKAKDGQLHTNFKLSASGEAVTLKAPNDSTIDSVTFTALKDNESYGRKTDGASQWVVFSNATPTKTNVYSTKELAVKDPVFSHKAGFYTSQFDLKLSTDEADTKIYYTLNGSDPVPGTEGTFEYIKPILVKSRAGEPNVLSMISNINGDIFTSWKMPKGEVFKCTTLKAVAIKNNGNKSKIITNSYFVDNNMMSRYKLPVISLVTDQANFFDNKKGIYVNGNYNESGREWERPVHFEFFEDDGTLAISQYSGIRINGGYTRKSNQKSFRLYAGHDYDAVDKYKYEIFPDLKKKASGKKLDKFDQLILRNSGNDNSWTMFKDAFIQGLVSHLNVDTMAYRPSVVFIDGEFWGIYNIRERYDSDFIKSHYGADKDKIVMLEVLKKPEVSEGEADDVKLYQEDVINYLKKNDIANASVYENIKTKIDIQNYINYNVTEIYCGNTDWPSNNTFIWKYKTDDGKYHSDASYGLDGRWRWMLKDIDFGFGFPEKSPFFDSLKYATSDGIVLVDATKSNTSWIILLLQALIQNNKNTSSAVFLLKTLIQNTEFRNEFINSFADQLNTSFTPERVSAQIDKYKEGIQTAMPEQCDRWQNISMTNQNDGEEVNSSPLSFLVGQSNNLAWDDNIKILKNYAEQRPPYMRQCILNKFKDNGVTGTFEINLTTDTTQGYVKVNTIDIKTTTPGITDASSWKGIYFKGVPVTLKAIPNDGYKFDHWEGISGVTTTSDTITFDSSGNVSVKPVFTAN